MAYTANIITIGTARSDDDPIDLGPHRESEIRAADCTPLHSSARTLEILSLRP